MKYVKFKRFGAKNFKCHIEPIDVVIPENGIVLLSGPNGSGKTSIVEILPFTFFGRTPKKLTSNDVVNNKMDKDCVTFVEYEIHEEDGSVDNYKCTRYCKYKSVGNSVVLSKNDNKNYKVGHKEVIKEIAKLWTNEVFMNTMFFAQKVKDFFMDIQDSDQKQIFKSILKTQDYETYKDIANKKEKEYNNKVNDINNKINLNNKLVEDSNNQISRLDEEKKEFYVQKEIRLNNLKNEINELKELIDKLELQKNNTNINQLKDELKFLYKNKNDIEYKIENLEESKQKEFKDLNDQLTYKKTELENKFNKNHNELINKVNEILEEKRKDIELKNENIQKELNELTEKYNNLNQELTDKVEDLRKQFEEDNERLQNENQDLINKENELKIKETELNTNIQNIENNIEAFFKDSSKLLSGEVTTCPICKTNIDDHTKEEIQNEVNDLNNKKDNLIKEKDNIKDDISSLIENKKLKLEEIEKLKNDFNENKKSIELLYKESFNELINEKKIKEDLIKNNKQKLENEKNKLKEENKEELNELKNKYNEAINKLNQFNKQKTDEIEERYKKDEVNLKDQLKEKENQINTTDEKINNYNNLITELNTKENNLKTKEEYLTEKENEEFDEGQIEYYRNKIVDHRNQINEYNIEYESYKQKLEAIEFWKKGFSNSGIPSMLIDEAIPFMNRTIRQYLDDMSYGRYSVTFDTLKQTKGGEYRDKISINIFDNVTSANQRQQLSGGQARLIDIATILTLSDLQSYIQNIKSNLLIFDEIFDSLDDTNIGLVSKSLRKISEDKSMLIISHTHIDQLEADDNLQLYS